MTVLRWCDGEFVSVPGLRCCGGSALGGLEAFVDFFQGVCQVLAYVFYGAVAALNFYRKAGKLTAVVVVAGNNFV